MSKGQILKTSCRLRSPPCLGDEQYISLLSAFHQRSQVSNTEDKTKEGDTPNFPLG